MRITRAISPAKPAIDPPAIAPTFGLLATALVLEGVADAVFDTDAPDAVVGIVVVALLVVIDSRDVREDVGALVLLEELVDDRSTTDDDPEGTQQSYWHPLAGKQ